LDGRYVNEERERREEDGMGGACSTHEKLVSAPLTFCRDVNKDLRLNDKD